MKLTWIQRWEALQAERAKMTFEILKSLNKYELEREGRIKEIAFFDDDGRISSMTVTERSGFPMPRKSPFSDAEKRLLRGISCLGKAMELRVEQVLKFKRDEQRLICAATLVGKSAKRGFTVVRLP